MQQDVLIIGGGPVGLTLALDLGRRGIKVRLVEQKPAPQFLPKMERCNARTMEIFRRLGVADKIRAAGLDGSVPMDVYVVQSLVQKPLLHLEYESADAMQMRLDAVEDLSAPAEAYQLISQYTLEPLLKAEAEALPNVTLDYGLAYVSHSQDAEGVTATCRRENGEEVTLRAQYLVGCDGGASRVRHDLGIRLRGEGGILQLRQALYRCDGLFDRIPMGEGPGHGRHYHVADDQASFLIMQDSTKHWTLHAVVEDDAAMARQFEKVVGAPVHYEMLYVGEWKMNLLLADRYGEGRVFLAGDAVHLVIPTGGLGMNTGVGDAVDLSWKLAAAIQGWAGPKLLESYEIERRQIGDRNIGASRYASTGRRKWRSQWRPEINDATSEGQAARDNLAQVAETEQRKTNEMIGAELGYRYEQSPLIWDEPGGPEHLFRTYQPGAWTGTRLPHCWVSPGVSILDLCGAGYTLLSLADSPAEAAALERAFAALGVPFKALTLTEPRLRELYGRRFFLLRPDLHIAWRGDEMPQDIDTLARLATGHPTPGMARYH